MTIDELLSIAGLTANDEIPVWDAEATGEPTRKITAQQLAAAVVALASLVTGVKGNAEGAYRHGDVNITPADIGAVNKAGDTMTGPLTTKQQISINDSEQYRFCSIYLNDTVRNIDNALTILGYTDGHVLAFRQRVLSGTKFEEYQLPAPPATASEDSSYMILTSKSPVTVLQGGTGATTAYAARANLGCNDIGINEAQPAINLVNDDQIHNITISADCWVCVSLHVVANTNGLALVWRNSIPVINNENTNGACNYWANAQFPCRAGGLLQYRLNTNANDSYISFLTV